MYITSSIRFIILLLVNLCITLGLRERANEGSRHINPRRLGGRQKMFLFYKSNAINERPCNCPTQQSCSCCEDVTLLLIRAQRRLCANLMYQRNGLNIDISLDSNTVRSMTVTNYRPLKICTLIPGSLFSGVCLNLIELNAFPRSLTVCPRFQITTKDQEWRINYTCVSISTELPMANGTSPMNGMPSMMGSMSSMGSMGPMGPMNQMIMSPQGSTTSSPGTTPGRPAQGGSPGGQPGGAPGGQPAGAPGGVPGGQSGGAPAGAPGGQSGRSPRGPPGGGPAGAPGGPPGGATGGPPEEEAFSEMPESTGAEEMPDDTSIAVSGALTAPNIGQSWLKSYGAKDRTKYFPSRLPPAYAASFGHNFTSVNS
ncbi:mucin-1-like [Diachasma alloeum]|uniref:mucin-1-like n=1 Tax=Diachasma alloeum TaxID=454923 RepID=UPI0007383AF8|nr:mucin-1-like [Diachasma alloeum]